MSGQYFATYVEDLEQDPFDAMDFVERVAWRMMEGSDTVADPVLLRNKFEEEIGSLQLLCEQFQTKINVLDQQLNKDKREYVNTLQKLHEKNADALDKIKQLDQTMQVVSTKVVHLGDQLESVHQPRQRAYDAHQLMHHFDEFLSDQPLNSMIFTDPDKLLESADLIQKLYSISQELSKEKFSSVQARIAHRYEEVEQLLIDEFARSQRDEKKMAEVAKILSEFKGYNHCVTRYVDYIQSISHARDGDVYNEALQLCIQYKPKIEAIFPAPMTVLQKLVLSLFTQKIKEHINAQLRDCKESNDHEGYLVTLAQAYSSTLKLVKNMESLHISSDASFLPMLCNSIFDRFISTYAKEELDYISLVCSIILNRFYESKKHIKKQIQSGGFQDLKRDVQTRFLAVETYGGETFLSEEVAINILNETKKAFGRASQLCDKVELPKVVENILDLLLKYLYNDHLDYAVELGLAGISLAEPKTEPPAYFFSIVAQNATIVHLMVKQYEDSVYPLIKNSNVEQAVAKKWSNSLRSLEQKINLGLERQLNAIVGYCRYVLSTEQKKGDFRPDNPALINIGATPACLQVVKCINTQITVMERCCDGANLGSLQAELSQRLYKMMVNHVQQFTYNSSGAMLMLCDVKEYLKCVNKWKASSAKKLFEALHDLVNLLLVLPENIPEAASSIQLQDVDRSLISDFLKLRNDSRNLRI